MTKEVRLLGGRGHRGGGPLANEIDEVRWLDVVAASDQLDYARDRDQLRALVRADNASALATWPLALVRHAKAFPRSQWKDADDQLRPLDRAGEQRSRAIVPLLAAYGVTRGEPRRRCGAPTRCARMPRGWDGRSAQGGALRGGLRGRPAPAIRHLQRLLERGRPAALCSHGPVLPALLDELATLVDPTSDDSADAAAARRGCRVGWPRERCWWRTSSTAASGPAGGRGAPPASRGARAGVGRPRPLLDLLLTRRSRGLTHVLPLAGQSPGVVHPPFTRRRPSRHPPLLPSSASGTARPRLSCGEVHT